MRCDSEKDRLVSTLSDSGMSAVPRTSSRLNWPPVTSTLAMNSGPGSRVTMLIAPPMVFRPNRVPCGPFRISTRATSSMEVFAPTLRAR